MIPLSCVNCCFNALQHDTVGTTVGYCTEHRKILHLSSELTCGKQLRKDLPLPSARREQELHQRDYSPSFIALLSSNRRPNGDYTSADASDLRLLQEDAVALEVTNYGRLSTKIVSLARLNMLSGARAETALMSLGRSYVRRCVDRGGAWTSGLHLVWWARQKLLDEPELRVEDIRVELPVPLSRQIDLAKWAVVMFRLIFISDIGHYAKTKRHNVRGLAQLAEDAAVSTGALSLKRLMTWVRREGVKRFDKVLPEAKYVKLVRELSKREDDAPPA